MQYLRNLGKTFRVLLLQCFPWNRDAVRTPTLRGEVFALAGREIDEGKWGCLLEYGRKSFVLPKTSPFLSRRSGELPPTNSHDPVLNVSQKKNQQTKSKYISHLVFLDNKLLEIGDMGERGNVGVDPLQTEGFKILLG
jgi:hypothetical protein